MITNDSYPNLKTLSGKANEFNIVGIQEKNGVISFKIVKDGTLLSIVEDFETMTANTSTTDKEVNGQFAKWSFNKAGVRAPGGEYANGKNSVEMKSPSQFYSVTPVYSNSYLARMTVFNPTSNVAKYAMEYSVDGGNSWVKALTPSGTAASEVPAKTNGVCYWNLSLDSKTPAQFRISQTSGNKTSPTYIDDFTLYYNEDSGVLPGDVNGDGTVNISDVNVLINMILAGNNDKSGDVNGDGAVNISDVNFTIAVILSGN